DACQRRLGIISLYRHYQDIGFPHCLWLCGHGDRHGEVRQSSEGNPVLFYVHRALPPRDDCYLFARPRQMSADDRPECPSSQDDDVHSTSLQPHCSASLTVCSTRLATL